MGITSTFNLTVSLSLSLFHHLAPELFSEMPLKGCEVWDSGDYSSLGPHLHTGSCYCHYCHYCQYCHNCHNWLLLPGPTPTHSLMLHSISWGGEEGWGYLILEYWKCDIHKQIMLWNQMSMKGMLRYWAIYVWFNHFSKRRLWQLTYDHTKLKEGVRGGGRKKITRFWYPKYSGLQNRAGLPMNKKETYL